MTPDQAAEYFRRALDAEIETTISETGVPLDQWRKANSQREGREYWFDRGPEMAAQYVKAALVSEDRPLVIDGSPALELELSAPGFEAIPRITGFLDHVAVNHSQRRIKIKDYKTGSRLPKDPAQLDTYGLLLATLPAGTLPSGYELYGEYWNARKASTAGERWLDEPGRGAIMLGRYAQADATVRAGLFNARPSEFCGSCAVRAHCPIMATKGTRPVVEAMPEFTP